MKIAFFGTPRLAQITLEKLVNSPFKPNLVVTGPDTRTGRGRNLASSPVKQTALANNIPVSSQLAARSSQFDLAILVAYGKILPKNILSIPKHGFINIHPSLLPKYRGPSPIQTAILNDKETGSTIILLDEEVDHGPILTQKKIPIDPTDTHESLIEKLGNLGSDLLLEALPDYLLGKIKPQPQNHIKATFTEKITKQDGKIDINNPPDSQTLDRMIRAFYPWPGVWTEIEGKLIKFLPGNLIQPEGKRPMSIKEFLNGYPKLKEVIQEHFTLRAKGE